MASTNAFLTLYSTVQTNLVGSTITTGFIPYISTAGRQAYSNTLSTLTVSTLTTTNVNTSTMVTSSLTSSALNTTTLTLASLSVNPSNNINLIGTNPLNNQVVTATAPAYYYGYIPTPTNSYTTYLPWTTGLSSNFSLIGTSIYPLVTGYFKITVSIINGGESGAYYYYAWKSGSQITGMTAIGAGLGANFNPTSMCGIVQLNASSDYIQIYGPNNTLSGGCATIVIERLLP